MMTNLFPENGRWSIRKPNKKSKNIKSFSDKEAEEFEDQELEKLMEKSRTGKLLSESEKADFLKNLKDDAES